MNIKAYKEKVTLLIQFKIDCVCLTNDYDSIQDVAASNVVGGYWEEEAKAILLWVDNLWVQRNVHFESIDGTEDPNDFVNSLEDFVI